MKSPSKPRHDLPESLARVPNIPVEEQTIEQLKAERDYWQSIIDGAPIWGGSLTAAAEFMHDCNQELRRRKND